MTLKPNLKIHLQVFLFLCTTTSIFTNNNVLTNFTKCCPFDMECTPHVNCQICPCCKSRTEEIQPCMTDCPCCPPVIRPETDMTKCTDCGYIILKFRFLKINRE